MVVSIVQHSRWLKPFKVDEIVAPERPRIGRMRRIGSCENGCRVRQGTPRTLPIHLPMCERQPLPGLAQLYFVPVLSFFVVALFVRPSLTLSLSLPLSFALPYLSFSLFLLFPCMVPILSRPFMEAGLPFRVNCKINGGEAKAGNREECFERRGGELKRKGLSVVM